MTLRTACHAVVVLACAGLPALAPAAEADGAPAAAPAPYDKDRAHGYLGFGLVVESSSFSQPLLDDVDASGGGLVARGAGHSGKVNPSLDIGFSGQLALMSREFDGTSEEAADFLIELDGGLRLGDLFYVSLGYLSQATGYDSADVTTTYNVVPISAGILKAHEAGYLLLQLRLGGGSLGNDQNSDTDSVKYGGLRAVLQHGFGSGVQFMLGLGLDRYTPRDNVADDYVRLDFGLGFGL